MLNSKNLKTTISVKRKVLPLVPAYSITTHKSQGQTLPKIVIDLNMPPGMVEVASAYVSLSRVQQLTDLVILQDFSINALQQRASQANSSTLATQYYIIVIPFLVSISALRLHSCSNEIFAKDTTIVHPETGLFLDYVGLYTPSEKIIHTSAIFPMTTDSCHFLPPSAAGNIPSCNITTKNRRKRFVDSIVSVGIGSASLALSISNTILIGNLQQQVALVENTLSKFSQTVQIHGAQLAKLTLKHIELTEQLEITQEAIDEIVPVLDKHSEAITTLKAGLEHLQFQLRHSFLYLVITQICNNELTLDFLSPEDIRKVAYNVIKLGNLTFNSYPGSLPVVQIITKLLVRQQIDFISKSQYITNDPDEIGRLVITSFFAVPRQEQIPFYVYKLLTIPFFHENETIELAQIPRYWTINSINNTTMEWHHPQEFGCDLRLMTSCCDTPPIRTISNDTCLN
ncbi:unnamed protein product [Rotaria magnacalcarata]